MSENVDAQIRATIIMVRLECENEMCMLRQGESDCGEHGKRGSTFGALPKVDIVAKLATPAVHIRRLPKMKNIDRRRHQGACEHDDPRKEDLLC